ncbi:hypothetical protein BBO_08293 [Beauveria brongniartii RCEF 3172]|uniref:Uncharacterized protein n=1 Tax=Beauveria brongniartii RCEF 3172 TaxID=1081107 RepID=A0A166XS71_9HYPO|nr:hypothetical protein BBO_08293 [Beauveria brongniartii RCEF 3172]
MSINAEIEFTFYLATWNPKLLWETVENESDYADFATSLKNIVANIEEASTEEPRLPCEPAKTLSVPKLQPAFGKNEKMLEAANGSTYESIHARLRQKEKNAGKKIDPAIWAVAELGHRCYQYKIRPPKDAAVKRDLPSLLWGTDLIREHQRPGPKEMPYSNRDSSTPLPWASEDCKEPGSKYR